MRKVNKVIPERGTSCLSVLLHVKSLKFPNVCRRFVRGRGGWTP